MTITDPALQAIADAWSHDGEGRDEELARELSEAYVAENPTYYDSFVGLDEKQIVKSLETFRDAGMENEEWRAQAWLFRTFEPQNIGGNYRAQLRPVAQEDGNA